MFYHPHTLMVYLLLMITHPSTDWAQSKAIMLIYILNHVTIESNCQ